MRKMNHSRRRIPAVLAALLLAVAAPCAHAGIVLDTTRVIYPAERQEVPLRITNTGTEPELVQAWIDRGDIDSRPTTTRAPFTVSPSSTRIPPGETHTMHIRMDGDTLPHDAESVFWLNVLDAAPPPSVELQSTHNLLAIAARSRIKLFYRPARLSGSPLDTPSQLAWALVHECGSDVLRVENPTPYAVSFARLGVTHGSGCALADTSATADMVKPGETVTFSLACRVDASDGLRVKYEAIGDDGGVWPGEAPLPVETATSCGAS